MRPRSVAVELSSRPSRTDRYWFETSEVCPRRCKNLRIASDGKRDRPTLGALHQTHEIVGACRGAWRWARTCAGRNVAYNSRQSGGRGAGGHAAGGNINVCAESGARGQPIRAHELEDPG